MTRKMRLYAIFTMMMTTFMCTPIFAMTEQKAEVKIVNNSENITDDAISELVRDVNTSFVCNDGTIIPTDTTITINDISPLSIQSNNSKKYQIDVKSNIKVEADSDNKNNEGVTASIHIKLYWDDVLGPENIFHSVEGHVDITQGTIKDSTVTYGALGVPATINTLNLGTKTSFKQNVNIIAQTPTANYVVYFKDAVFQLNVSVTPSVMD